MDEKAFREMDELQKSHWWYLGRRRIVKTLFHKYIREAGGDMFLDVGCGAGEGSCILSSPGQLTGLDESDEALAYATRKGYAEVRKGSAERLPFVSNTYFGVLALDVLEHVDDDNAMLQECHRVLRQQGTLLLTVPAYMWMWSTHDELFGHKRRYLKRDLLKEINDAGFEIVFASYYCTLLFMPGVIFNQVFRKYIHRNAQNFFPMPKALNALLYGIFSIEAPLLRIGLKAPFGSSIIVVARKK
jgi:SAM-dependent methyltransferase